MTNPLPTREEVKAIVERLREAGFSDRVYVEDGRLMRQTADLLERLSERDGSERDSPQKAVIDTEQQPHAPSLVAAIDAALGHLGAALMQSSQTDDRIIENHIRAANEHLRSTVYVRNELRRRAT